MQAPGADPQLAARPRRVDAARDGGRDAVPVDVPPRAGMAQEAAALVIGRLPPDVLDLVADPIEDGLPRHPLGAGRARVAAQLMQLLRERPGDRVAGGERRVGRGGVRVRHQPAAGDRLDRPAMARVQEGE